MFHLKGCMYGTSRTRQNQLDYASVQAKKASAALAASSAQCDVAAATARHAAHAVQDAEIALANARRAADAVQVMLQAKQAQGLDSHAEELKSMAQMHDNEVHR